MRFPLLVHASPSTQVTTPRVLLRKGKWKVVSSEKDSQVIVMVGDKSYKNGDVFDLEDHEKSYAFIAFVGTEKELNVFLESQ